ILRQAGVELARLAQALVRRVGPRPIGFIGGVLVLHPATAAEIRDTLGGREGRLLNADASLAAAPLQAGGNDAWLASLAAQPSGSRLSCFDGSGDQPSPPLDGGGW